MLLCQRRSSGKAEAKITISKIKDMRLAPSGRKAMEIPREIKRRIAHRLTHKHHQPSLRTVSISDAD
jgi:hypothetical protein